MYFNLINQQSNGTPRTNCGIQYQAPANNFKNTSIFNNLNAFTTNNIYNTTNNFISVRNNFTVNNFYDAPKSGLQTVGQGFKQRIGNFFNNQKICQPKIAPKTGCGCNKQPVKQNIFKPMTKFNYGQQHKIGFFQRGAFSGVADMFRSFMSYRFK